MPRSAPRHNSGSTSHVRLLTGTLVAVGAVLAAAVWPAAHAQSPAMDLVVGRNVNIVAGQTLPNGDPYLQRQNEPSVAASTRNPLHLLAGSNDYRTVDIPGMPEDGETGDAWLGVFKSFDGGERWQSGLLPGYPQDTSAEGMASPLKGYHAGADPVVRPGTNGLLYYSGLVFNRGEGGESAIFVSRFVDNNNKENGDPIAYISTSIVAKSSGKEFLDKPWMAVDVPRAGAKVCRISTQQAAPQLTAAARERLAKSGKGASGAAVSTAAQTIKNTRTTKGTPAVLPTPGVAQVTGTATTVSQQVLAGTMYVAYAAITTTTLATGEKDVTSRILFSRSDDCGATWSRPVQISDPLHKVNQGAAVAVDPTTGLVHVAWRQFGLDAASPDAIMATTVDPSTRAAKKARRVHEFATRRKADNLSVKLQRAHRLGEVKELVGIKPFDSDTTEERFRTNAYPSMAIDDESRVYLAWTERGFGGRPLVDLQGNPLRDENGVAMDPAVHGDARVVVSTSRAGGIWTPPQAVDTGSFAGHQMMPSVAYAGGRLMIVYYDLRQDISQVFGTFVDEFDAVYSANKRHTIDVRAVQAPKGDVPVFGASTMVSQYLMGNLRGSTQIQQLQFNAPNLPLFQLGTVPFMGDYIDIAPAPAFVQNPDGRWIHNTANTSAPVFHAVWTDNRDVQKPADGDWKNYTPPGGATCAPGQTGMRNQNVYSARITMGLVAGSPSNTKPLDATTPRSFVVFAQNATYEAKAFRLTIENQPVGGQASFNQLGLLQPLPMLTSVDLKVAPRSMVARTVYATSSNPKEQVRVQVTEIDFDDFSVVPSGLATKVILNPDISNPDISNPDISNPDISNPDISNAEVYNPDISNPDISNPDISNPDISNPDISNPDISNVRIANPDISNPDISNPDISNPDISNPDISNPDISNPDISNGSLTDVTWTIRNDGNTTASFNVNLFLANQSATTGGIKTQLVVHKTYKTPVSDGCVLKSQTQTVLVAKVDDPVFLNAGQDPTFDPANPDISNTTLWLEPGGEGKITLRIVDPNPTDAIEINPVEDITPVVTAQPVNTDDLDDPMPEPPATPLPTDPQPVPDTMLTFVAQPVNTLVNAAMPNITVAAFAGVNPAPGVQVTLAIAINPSGGNLAGTVTTLTDALGIATFPSISINRDGAGYRLSASASAAGALPVLSDPFTVGALAPPPPSGTWTVSGDGSVVLTDNGLVGGTPRMTYQRSGSQIFNGAWTLSTVAAAGTTVRLDWEWTGFHSWCGAAVQLRSFVNRAGNDVFVGPLLQMADSCTGWQNPSAGFAFAGTTSVVVQPGDTYGFRLNGSHGDGTDVLEGAFGVVVNGATSASPFVVTNASDDGPGSLRAALVAANADVDLNTITFAIPGAWLHTIAPATPLPVIATPMIIDGLSQPGAASMAPMINLDGRTLKGQLSIVFPLQGGPQAGVYSGLAAGFEVVSSDVTIRGLGINRFPGAGVFVFNGANNVRVEDNVIGTHPTTGLGTSPENQSGVDARYPSNLVIARNVISGSRLSGIGLTGGSGTVISGNRIGTSTNGLVAAPNLDNGITMFDGANNTTIAGNLISGNGTYGLNGVTNGYGIDIQQSGGLADVTNTVITNNVIGLDAVGNLIDRGGAHYTDPAPALTDFGPINRGNAGGGIRVIRGSGTIIGGAGGGNTISGNGGTGIRIEGTMAVAPVVTRNRVGTNPAGTLARGNAVGIDVFLSSAMIGGPATIDRNIVSGNIRDGIAANGNTTIENNFVGTDVTGTLPLGNSVWNGPDCCHTNIFVSAPNNIVRGNVVAGNNAHNQNPGIRSGGALGAAPNLIEDNMVGTDVAGTLALGNGVGIGLFGDKSGTIVRRNVIANNPMGGVWLVEGTQGALIGGEAVDGNTIRNNGLGIMVGDNAGAQDVGNSLLSNRIFGNTNLGIDLGWNGVTPDDAGDSDSGPNGLQNFGVLSNVVVTGPATQVDILVDTDTTNATYDIQVFANTACHASGFGQGQRLVGSFKRSSNGAGDIVASLALTEAVPPGQWLTATVTQVATGNTSEFSACVAVPAGTSGSITSATPANGKGGEGFLVFRGSNLPATIGDVIAEVSNGGTTMNGFWFPSASSSTAAYVRMPLGMPLGSATVRLRNNAGTVITNNFPITITAVPGTPVITGIRDAGANIVVTPVQAGTTIYVGADGIDTTGAVVRFTQGALTWDVTGVAASNTTIGMTLQVNVPGDASTGTLDVSIRQGAGAFSLPGSFPVTNPGFIGPAGGPGGNPFGPVTCNPGSVLTALTGEAGSFVGRMTMWCAPVQAGPSLGPAVASAVIGIPGNGPVDFGAALTCPANHAITGIFGTAGNVGWGVVVDGLGVRCTNVATNAVHTTGMVGGQATAAFSLPCPAGEEAIGFAGGFGDVLDRIGIVCANRAAPEAALEAALTFEAGASLLQERIDLADQPVTRQVIEEDGRRFAFAREAAIEFRRRFRVGA